MTDEELAIVDFLAWGMFYFGSDEWRADPKRPWNCPPFDKWNEFQTTKPQ